MDEVLPGLWIGDLPSAQNVETLKEKKIFSILSAMRGRVTINETFIRHQIMLDDTEEADILIHFMPSISFIEAELDKGRSVLVHCQAGMSRSAAIVAAYIMYTQKVDVDTAMETIRKARPSVQPNEGFLAQLEIFQQASYRISRQDKTTRRYYLERAVEEIMNGDGTLPETSMFARYPRTPSGSAPSTPGAPRRRIRCKMCRQELATREHMLDHGQLGPDTPAISFSNNPSRRGSMSAAAAAATAEPQSSSRRSSANAPIVRRPSNPQPRSRLNSVGTSDNRGRRSSLLSGIHGRGMSEMLSMSALRTDEDDNAIADSDDDELSPLPAEETGSRSRAGSGVGPHPSVTTPVSVERAILLGRRLSNTLSAATSPQGPASPDKQESYSSDGAPVPDSASESALGGPEGPAVTHIPSPPPVNSQPPSAIPSGLATPADLAAQLSSNPKLAALRSSRPLPPGLGPLTSLAKPTFPPVVSPPILANPKCSGYFVEPMHWMEPFLQNGQLAGKITCPNPKCGVKLGNYDWAGVCCSCKEWVTPGFCIHRSKVDEFI